MDKKFFLAFILIFVISLVLGFVTHGWALADEYEATGLFRLPAEQEGLFPWMLLAHVILSYAFVAVYKRGLEERAWVGQGIRFGILLALLIPIPMYMIYYTVQPMPEMLVFRQASYETVNVVILGLVVAWVYR